MVVELFSLFLSLTMLAVVAVVDAVFIVAGLVVVILCCFRC